MPGGYHGRYLEIDLTSGTWSDLPLSAENALPCLGGKGVAAMLLHRLLAPGTDPLSPDNIVVLNTGPLTDTGTPGSSRCNLSTKSPLTGGIATSNSGGRFGLQLKRAGYDGLILRGRAPRPVWLEIDGEGVRFSDASSLWGKGALEAQLPLATGEGKIAIGPAGENLVRFACVMSGDRTFARGGVGAVLGSKNLKGATVRGSGKAPVNDAPALKRVIAAWTVALKQHPITGTMLSSYGTAVLVNRTNAASILPTRNFQAGSFSGADDISGESMEELVVGRLGCHACPVRCGRLVEDPEGAGRIRGPEYETIGLFGANLGIASLASIFTCNRLCDELGLDTISAGVVLGTAMELAERGLLKTQLRFGSTDGLERALEDIAFRRGLGDEMAQGARHLASTHGLPHLAPQVKGMELPAYNPRAIFGHALGYAVSNRGACHIGGGYMVFLEGAGFSLLDPWEWRGKAALVVLMQNLMEGVSASGGCVFHAFPIIPRRIAELYTAAPFPRLASRMITYFSRSLRALNCLPPRSLAFNLPLSFFPFPQALEAVTGEGFTLGRFLEAGARIYNLERLFNLREGLNSSDDTLPERFTGDAEPGIEGRAVPLDKLVPDYYRNRGWDHDGRPSARTLHRLKIDNY
jgi:aldehyde:ferredoxin oxidoreductase